MKSLFSKFRKNSDEEPAPAAAAAPEQKKPSRGLTIRVLVMPLLLTSLITLVVVAALVYLQFSLVGLERRDAITHAETDRLAAVLAGRLRGYTDVIAAAGRAPAVVAALKAGDQTALDEHVARLRVLFPSVLRIRFIARGDDRLDENAVPPLSYACLELARTAEAGQEPPVEAHLYGTKVQHVDLLRPVVGDKEIVGSLLVTLDVAVLREWLRPLLNGGGGYVELRQGTGDKHLMLAALGDAGLQATPATYAAPVAGTAWSLVYWAPGSVATVSTAEQVGLLTVFGVALVVLIVAFVLFTTLAGRIVRGDLVAVVKQAVEMWSGRRQHNFDVKLAESLEVLNALEQHLATQQPRAVHPDAARAAAMQQQEQGIIVDEPPEGDDMPSSLMFMAQDAVQVEELGALATRLGGGKPDDKSK
ncbi:hypothetical protein [Sulfurivermis fontis]|uniref:hypothetical protein n=1 Tax=Sulfurivermis fontis TaxID=1972068 RepID=UPI000FDA1BA6|nr:hypothetical protein [Sulfurivermis fontis]